MAKAYKDMTFLIADDMSNMRRTIRGMLRQMGVESFLEASNGMEALEQVRSESIDFIVTDWNMPKMSGLDLLRKIRENEDTKNIPILMVTAEITEEQVAHAAETLVDGYIIKPFVFNVFEAKMKEILEKRSKPHPVDRLLEITGKLIKGNQAAKVIPELAKAIAKYPKSARLLVAMAQAHESIGEDGKAVDFYQKATEVNPLFTKGHEGLAAALKREGRNDEALKSYEKAAKISPNNPARQKEIGQIHLENGDKTKAKVAFNVALKQAGTDHAVAQDIGEAFMKAGMADEAATAFKQTLSHDPKNLHVYNRLGIALRKKGRYTEAINEYKKALAIAPNDEALYFNLSKAFMEARRYKEALHSINQALKIDADFEEAKKLKTDLERANAPLG